MHAWESQCDSCHSALHGHAAAQLLFCFPVTYITPISATSGSRRDSERTQAQETRAAANVILK